MIFYLTYNDAPSGIYSSQVIDVVNFLNNKLNADVKLISFISLRGFLSNRRQIKLELPAAIVLPMFPGIGKWRNNVWLLHIVSLIRKPKAIIGRSVLATNLALLLNQKRGGLKVVYDGRGAIQAEWREYKVITDKIMLGEIHELEENAILNSYYRIAVSNELVNFWQKEFLYSGTNHVVIPCTLNSQFDPAEVPSDNMLIARNKLGLNKDDIVFVYSGSTAGWQSFDLLFSFIVPLLKQTNKHKIVFFTQPDQGVLKLKALFPNQVISKKLHASEVSKYLIVGNYGLLIREESVTNRVASPVKFAEYLACGLSVIISRSIGDYSKFVTEHNCGQLIYDFSLEVNDKELLRKIAFSNFTKESKLELYKILVSALNE